MKPKKKKNNRDYHVWRRLSGLQLGRLSFNYSARKTEKKNSNTKKKKVRNYENVNRYSRYTKEEEKKKAVLRKKRLILGCTQTTQ